MLTIAAFFAHLAGAIFVALSVDFANDERHPAFVIALLLAIFFHAGGMFALLKG